ncbi:MAG: hypothetical protein U0234_14915 [Sandaracinus sp.]
MSSRPSLAVLFASLSLVACGGGRAAESAPPPSSGGTSNASAGGETSGEAYTLADFTVLVTEQATPELCGAPDAALRACFRVDGAQCAELFGIAMTQCAHALEGTLPPVVDASNAEAVSTQIAQCAGQAYGEGLAQQGLRIDGCQ